MSTGTGLVRRAAPATAAVVAFALLGASAAQGPDWRTLPYFDYSRQLLSLATDGTWQSAQVVDAGVFTPTDGSGPGAQRRFIWAATCAEGEQFVSFSKTIMTPGAPIEGTVALYYGPGNQLYGDRPYKSAVLLVNSREAVRLGDIAASPRTVAPMFRGPLPPSALSAFQYGPNALTIRVEKTALKKGEPCNNPKPGRYIGVLADLELRFGSDLQVLPPTNPRAVKKRVANKTTVPVEGTVRFVNAGPSASPEGKVRLSASGPGQGVITSAFQASSPLANCKLDGALLECPFKDFRAGGTASLTYRAAVRVNYGFLKNGAGEIDVDAEIIGIGPDPNPANNRQRAVVIVCAEKATDPRCN
jgi:hypothetical protein